MQCSQCSGKRVVSQLQPEIRRSQGMDYTTGRMVERLYQCEHCGGTGTEPEGPPPAGSFTYFGCPVVAPGFDADNFQASLNRARKRGTLPIIPTGRGAVLVESTRTGARYLVTRDRCSCQGHATAGHCLHRAAVVACADLYGVDVAHTHVLGFDPAGHPVTAADRVAALEGVA